MRVRRQAWLIAGLGALTLLLALAVRGEREVAEQQMMPRRTTFSRAPGGLKALYLTLDALGYQTKRLRTPLRGEFLPEAGTLVVVEPMPLTDQEWSDVRSWVAKGNRLVLSAEHSLPSIFARDWSEDRAWYLPAPQTEAVADQPAYLAAGVARVAVRSEARVEVAARQCDRRTCNPGEAEVCVALKAAVPVFRDDAGVVVSHARVGRGRVVLMSSPWSLSNEGIGEEGNFAMFLNAIGPAEAPVYFDEYHQGYGSNAIWAMLPAAAKFGIGQVVLGLLLVIFARSRRLGPVVPLDHGHRQRSEFLGTMATVLERGRATRLAVGTARQAAVARLLVLTGAKGDDEEEISAAVARWSPEAGTRVAAALRAAREGSASPGELSEARAAALVRTLDEAVEAARQV